MKIVICMKDNLKMVILKDSEDIFGMIKIIMWVNGKNIKRVVLVRTTLQMVKFKRESLRMTIILVLNIGPNNESKLKS